MEKNRDLRLEQLIGDPTFVAWAKGEHSIHTGKWEEKFQENPEERLIMEEARFVVLGIPFNRRFISRQNVEKAWSRLERSIDEKPKMAPPSRHKVMQVWKWVAAVLLLILAGGGAYTIYQNGEVVYHTGFGERMEVTLSDGTMVMMNANSTLRFVRKRPRRVTMTGEMYFDVEKKPETGETFLVTTPDLDIQVLGTEFNVNSRQEKTEVLLDEGSIQLEMKKKGKMFMKPGDLVSYSAADDAILEHEIAEKPEVITSWKEGVLLLDSVSLASTLTLLEDTYDVKTIIKNQKMRDKILVGGVPNDNLETCVKALSTIYNIDIEIASDTLIVR